MVRGVSLASPLLEMWLHIHSYTSQMAVTAFPLSWNSNEFHNFCLIKPGKLYATTPLPLPRASC